MTRPLLTPIALLASLVVLPPEVRGQTCVDWRPANLRSRASAAMAYDSARARLIVFGGQDAHHRFGDTWESAGGIWLPRPGVGPSARTDAAMVFDSARSRTLLFGGFDPLAGSTDETWEFDGVAGIWTLRAVSGPSGRSGHAVAFDSARGRVVLFGGYTADGARDAQTWEWDGQRWTLAATTGPSPRALSSMAYDVARGRTVLFGGETGTVVASFANDTWGWDGAAWAMLAPEGSGPSARAGHGMDYDANRGRVVLFGGYSDPISRERTGDTWEWNGAAWAEVTPPPSAPQPSARARHLLAFDAARSRVALFGGDTGEPDGDSTTWEWTGTAWSPRADLVPSPRDGAAMAYDAAREQVVLFGGSVDGGQGISNQTWVWNGSFWMLAFTPGPTARTNHAMAYDAARQKVVLFGGWTATGLGRQTWEWDGGWIQRSDTGPSRRLYHGMAFDPNRQRVVLFGGMDENGDNGETWEWNGEEGTWSMIGGTGSGPPALRYFAMSTDTARGRIVLTGGYNASWNDGWGNDSDGTWELGPEGWALRTLGGPGARHLHASAFDPIRQRTVVFGGRLPLTGQGLDDTWEWDGQTWVRQAAAGPISRSGHVMAFDAARGMTLMFGGYGDRRLADTWAIAPTSPTITRQPTDTVAVAGHSVFFSAQAGGAPVQAIQWRKNGEPLTDGPRVSGSGSAVLTIDPVQPDDAGMYDAAVFTTCDVLMTLPANLTVFCATDLDQNGRIEPADAAMFVGLFLSGIQIGTLEADFNRDGALTPLDVSMFVASWAGSVAAGGC